MNPLTLKKMNRNTFKLFTPIEELPYKFYLLIHESKINEDGEFTYQFVNKSIYNDLNCKEIEDRFFLNNFNHYFNKEIPISDYETDLVKLKTKYNLVIDEKLQFPKEGLIINEFDDHIFIRHLMNIAYYEAIHIKDFEEYLTKFIKN